MITSVACCVKQGSAPLDGSKQKGHSDVVPNTPTPPAEPSLSVLLRRLRKLKAQTLRDVENETKISNAYLSQLENGTTTNPSPHVLHKLADHYGVPYESLMEAAGYLKPATGKKTERLGAVEAALMSLHLTDEEQEKVTEFVAFLRSQRKKK